jgi:hypothetical protein
MKLGPAILAAALAATAIAAAPAAGDASTVSVGIAPAGHGAVASALALNVKGSPQADEISIALDGTQTQYSITSTRPINPPPAPCVQITTNQIHCPTADFATFSASLGAGPDLFSVGPSVKIPVTVAAGGGSDSVFGGSGPDAILGSGGSDRLLGRNGRDTISGGAGSDVVNGGEGRDTLKGLAGQDTLKGGAGRDLLQGGPGKDTLRGGSGRDVENQ